MRRLFLALAMAILPLSSALAERSLALVIGNNGYVSVPRLDRAINDAQAISLKLVDLGFTVYRYEDVNQRTMAKAFAAFEEEIRPGDRVMFYFAGHGVEFDGTNYLLPTDIPEIKPNEKGIVRDASFAVQSIVERLEAKGAGLSILVLDACRDNPFEPPTTRAASRTRGLARVSAPRGFFVLMSAGAKQSALDRLSDADPDQNSVFTRSFLNELSKPGQSLIQIAKNTQKTVSDLAATIGHEQLPGFEDQTVGDVYLTASTGGVILDNQVERVADNVETQINTSGETNAGAGVILGPGVQIGPGVTIGGKDAKIALQDVPNAKPGLERLAALQVDPNLANAVPQAGAPIANFTRSNAGWTATISTPVPTTSLEYRIGDGEFKSTGLLDFLDQRTGQRMPNPNIQLSGKAKAGIIEVRYRLPTGVLAGPFPVRFDPDVALFDSQRKALEMVSSNWVEFREFNGLLVYFTTLISYRCAIAEVRYGLDGAKPLRRFDLPKCDEKNPFNIPEGAEIWLKVPTQTASISVQLTYTDGTRSDIMTVEK